MTLAFLVDDSDDMPVPDSEEMDFSAVDPLADYAGDSSRSERRDEAAP